MQTTINKCSGHCKDGAVGRRGGLEVMRGREERRECARSNIHTYTYTYIHVYIYIYIYICEGSVRKMPWDI